MKQELQDKLFEKYPKIFRQQDLPQTESSMCWGVVCGDGWYDIINVLCECIKQHVEVRNRNIFKYDGPKRLIPVPSAPQLVFEVTQIKEKYGGLRFYFDDCDDYIRGLITMAESMSYKVCESCGAPGTQNLSGWIHTLCDKCRENKYVKNDC